MRTGSMVVGITGGIFALMIGLLGFTLGQVVGSPGVKILSLVIPIAGLSGAVLVPSRPRLGGALMTASGVGMLAILGVNLVSLLPAIPLLIGGLLSLSEGRLAGGTATG